MLEIVNILRRDKIAIGRHCQIQAFIGLYLTKYAQSAVYLRIKDTGINMRRIFPAYPQSGRTIMRSNERIAEAKTRASIETQIFEQELARVMSKHSKNSKTVR